MKRRPFQLDDLYRLAVPSDPQVSPDGTSIVYVLTEADPVLDTRATSIWIVATRGGAPVRLTDGPHDTSPRFSPDGATVLFLSSEGQNPAQLVTMSRDGVRGPRLTDVPFGAGSGVWSPDGSSIAFTAVIDTEPPPRPGPDVSKRPVVVDGFGYKMDGFGLRRGLREHVFVVPAGGGPSVQVTFGERDCLLPTWSPAGDELAYSTPDYTVWGSVLCPQQIGVVNVTTGATRLITASEAGFTALDWSPDADTLLLIGSDRAGLSEPQLWLSPAAGGSPQKLVPGNPGHHMPGWDLAVRGAFSKSGDSVRFGEWREATTQLFEVPLATRAPQAVLGPPERSVRAASFGDDVIAFVWSDADTVAELSVLRDGEEHQITHLQEERLADIDFVRPEVRHFAASDGTDIRGYVLRGPDVQGPTPMLVDLHGGPYNSWLPNLSEHFLYQQALAGLGWTILCVDPRGSASYGENFMLATNGNWGFSDEGDILAAVDALVEDGSADPDRLVVSGWSYGGYLAAWLTTRTTRFRAAITGVMTCNHVGDASDSGTLTSELIAGGSLTEAFDQLVATSPISRVAEVATPTLILQGEDDLRTPMWQGEQWFQALLSKGVEVRLVRYPNASHFFVLDGDPSQSLDAYTRLIDWSLDHTAPVSATAGYAR